MKCFSFSLLFIFLISSSADAADEVYLNLEKPNLAFASESKKEIQIEMARSEFEGFMVRLGEGNAAKAAEVRLKWKDKKDPPSKIEFRSYWVGVHQFNGSSFRKNASSGEMIDILVPNSVIALKQATIPPNNIPKRPIFYFEFHTDKDTQPGKYHAQLEIKHGKTKWVRDIEVWVHDLVLPDAFDLVASFGFDPWEVVLKTYGKWNNKDLDLYREYQNLALEHRIDLHKIYVKFPEAQADDLLQEAAVPEQSFLGQTTSLYAGRNTTFHHQMKMTDLPVQEKYKKAPTDQLKEAEIENFWKKLNESVVKHHLKEKTFVYFIDEPKNEDLKGIGERLKKIRKWAPDLKFMVTTHHRPSIDGAFNIWCINLFLWNKAGQETPEFYQRQQQKGDQLWFYVGCNSHGCTGPEDLSQADLVIDRPSAYQRAFPWIALRYQAQGILYYDTVYGYSHGDKASPYKDAFSFTGYGEGNLFYPCTSQLGGCKDPKIFPSFRLKVIRDGLEDVQILKMAKAKNFPVDEWVKALIPDHQNFPKATKDYEELKRKALRLMDAHGKE